MTVPSLYHKRTAANKCRTPGNKEGVQTGGLHQRPGAGEQSPKAAEPLPRESFKPPARVRARKNPCSGHPHNKSALRVDLNKILLFCGSDMHQFHTFFIKSCYTK